MMTKPTIVKKASALIRIKEAKVLICATNPQGRLFIVEKSESGTTEAPLPAKKINSGYLKRKPNWVSMPHLKVFR